MLSLLLVLMVVPPSVLIATVGLTNRWANSRAAMLGRVVTLVLALQCAIAAGGLLAYTAGWIPSFQRFLWSSTGPLPLSADIFYDGVSALMLTLVSFVGWVISAYSVRYLDGEATQGRYFRWIAFTIGSVSLMVLSGNLLMFALSWISTSVGLHQLLLHYGHGRASRRGAWTKFAISRIGDLALVGALVSIYYEFQTLDLPELFAAAASVTTTSTAMQWGGILLVVGAVTKSAQFPFHTWLPQTLETPTPVSALMHAGIVNAGGYLMIRTSPVVALAPWALTILAILGACTACFGAIVMLTQTSIKKSLAYSTIAQMGFMLMQCGLGAYSAAMLHILAHSLYKAYAFLNSGSVLTEQAATTGVSQIQPSTPVMKLITVGACLFAVQCFTLSMLGVDLFAKAGGMLLGGVVSLALTQWIGLVMRTGNAALFWRALGGAGGLIVVYCLCYTAVHKIIELNLPISTVPPLQWLTEVLVALGVVGLFAVQHRLATGRASRFLNSCQIHAANGFYVDSWLRRMLRSTANF